MNQSDLDSIGILAAKCVASFVVILIILGVMAVIQEMWMKTNKDYEEAHGEKPKKDARFNRAFDRLVYFLIGMLGSVPVALWAFGHLFWANIWGIPLTDVVLPILDVVMTFIAFAAFVGSIYYAGTRRAGPVILQTANEVLNEVVREIEKPQ